MVNKCHAIWIDTYDEIRSVGGRNYFNHKIYYQNNYSILLIFKIFEKI